MANPNRRGNISHIFIASVFPQQIRNLREKDLGFDIGEWDNILELVHNSPICVWDGLIKCKLIHRTYYTDKLKMWAWFVLCEPIRLSSHLLMFNENAIKKKKIPKKSSLNMLQPPWPWKWMDGWMDGWTFYFSCLLMSSVKTNCIPTHRLYTWIEIIPLFSRSSWFKFLDNKSSEKYHFPSVWFCL